MPIRYDWYQTEETVNIDVYLKRGDVAATVDITENSVSICRDNDHLSIEELLLQVVPSLSSHRQLNSKLELTLQKRVKGEYWRSLVREPQPTSFAVANPDRCSEIDDDETNSGEKGDLDQFFRSLYRNADEDSRRAMMKSFVTSGGTCLTTNWSDAESKDYTQEQK